MRWIPARRSGSPCFPLGSHVVSGPRLLWWSTHDARVNLAVAQRAMFEAQRLEFCLESLVLACLASVVLLLEDTLTRSYARREVTATLITVDVELAYHRVTITLRTLHLLTGPVRRRMP